MPTPDGIAKYREAFERLKRKQHPHKKSIEEMTLDELLELERKFLAWYPTHPDHPERSVKKHIYDKYIVPRIHELRQPGYVREYLLGEQPPAGSQIPLAMEPSPVQSTDN